MAAAGVLDHLDQRVHFQVEGFCGNAGDRIGQAEQRPGDRCIKCLFVAGIQLAAIKGLKVGTLASFDIDDLDIFARLDGKRLGRCPGDAKILHRISQRLRQRGPLSGAEGGAVNEDLQWGRGILLVEIHDGGGGRNDNDAVGNRHQLSAVASRRMG